MTTFVLTAKSDWDGNCFPTLLYSPDLAPTDYLHLFRALQNHLSEKSFDYLEALKLEITNFFDSKPDSFYSDGIKHLHERWRQVVNSEGQCIPD